MSHGFNGYDRYAEEHLPASALRSVPTTQALYTISMKKLQTGPRQRLPLHLQVASAAVEDGHVVYHCTMASRVSQKAWVMAYRYSEVLAFKNKVLKSWTCHSPGCTGSCEALRDYLSITFPHRRLLGSTSKSAINDRKKKIENVLLHMLRTVLFPGSAMKCPTTRQRLPKNVFKFLGVQDRRSLLQIFVDNSQDALKRHDRSSTASTASQDSTSTWTTVHESDDQCVICMEDFEEHDHGCCETDDELSCASPASVSSISGSKSVMLPCKHSFHRDCLFEWLLFEFHCPLCRSRVGPEAVTSICRPKDKTQWWVGDYAEDPIMAPKEML